MASMMQLCGAVARRVMVTQPPPTARLGGIAAAPILCGRGDKRTKKGKRFKGSYGNSRPKKDKKIERIKDRIEVPRRSRIRLVPFSKTVEPLINEVVAKVKTGQNCVLVSAEELDYGKNCSPCLVAIKIANVKEIYCGY